MENIRYSHHTKSISNIKKEIEKITIKHNDNISQDKIINKINAHLYKNFTVNNKRAFGWGEYFLTTVNVEKDIRIIDEWIKDCIRACKTGKKNVGGIGSVNNRYDYTMVRGKGKHVSSNLKKTEKIIKGYTSMVDMWKTINYSKDLYRVKARMM